jgi:hypothetical protein
MNCLIPFGRLLTAESAKQLGAVAERIGEGVSMTNNPDGKRWQWSNWLWIVVVVMILTCGFAKYNAAEWRLFLSSGVLCSVVLAIVPPRERAFESWVCLAVVAICGLIGASRFGADIESIHPRERFEILRLYVGLGIVAGVAIVLPYALIRLLAIRLTRVSEPHGA